MDIAPGLSERERDPFRTGSIDDLIAPAPADEDAAPDEDATQQGLIDDGGDAPRFAVEEVLGFAVLVVCFGVVLAALHPSLLFANTTASGGDMGAHVWWPAFLRDHWFNHFRLAGWSPDWYAGFPVGQFYFPLPALLIDGLAIVMPYDIAFKLVTVSGSLLLPISAYVFARTLKFPWPTPPLFALAVLRFLFEVRQGALAKGETPGRSTGAISRARSRASSPTCSASRSGSSSSPRSHARSRPVAGSGSRRSCSPQRCCATS